MVIVLVAMVRLRYRPKLSFRLQAKSTHLCILIFRLHLMYATLSQQSKECLSLLKGFLLCVAFQSVIFVFLQRGETVRGVLVSEIKS